MKNIYEQLEKNIQKDIILKPITKSPHRKAKLAYQRIIDPKEVTNE